MSPRVQVVAFLVGGSVRSLAGGGAGAAFRTLGSALLVASEAVGVGFLVDRAGGVGGWTVAEVLLLLGIADAGLGLGMLAAEPLEPPVFSQQLRDGRFELALTRPVSPLVLLTAGDVQLRNLGRVVAGAGLVVGAWAVDGPPVTAGAVALIGGAALAMGVVVASVLVVGAAITMWTVEGTEVLNAFTYGGATVSGWPLHIFEPALRAVFLWFVPVGLAVYVPVLAALDRDGVGVVGPGLVPVVPVVVIAFAGVARLLWALGLRRYLTVGA